MMLRHSNGIHITSQLFGVSDCLSRKYQSIFGHHVVLKARLYRVVLISSSNIVYRSYIICNASVVRKKCRCAFLSFIKIHIYISLVMYYYYYSLTWVKILCIKLVATILHASHSYLGCSDLNFIKGKDRLSINSSRNSVSPCVTVCHCPAYTNPDDGNRMSRQ